MKLQYNSHASITISSDNKSLITDPWFYEPIYGGMMWQFPRTNLPLQDYINADYIVITHFHPDHFCPKSLSEFNPKNKFVLIPDLSSMQECAEYLFEKGFEFYRVKDRETIPLGEEFLVTFYHNQNNIDSAQVINCRSINKSIYNMNDCFLSMKQLEEIKSKHVIDHSMIFFMGVGPYPGSFDLSLEEKHQIIIKKEISDYKRALETLNKLSTKTFTAYSNDMTWLRRPDLIEINGSLKKKFYDFISTKSNNLKSVRLESGDYMFLDSGETVIRSKEIENKNQILESTLALNQTDQIKNQINSIVQSEKSFNLDEEKLNNDMRSLLNLFNKEIKRNIKLENSRYPDHLEQTITKNFYIINFVLTPINKKFYFIYDREDNFVSLKDEFNLEETELTLNLEEFLWAAVQNGFYNTEDLMNCRFFIHRNGPYTDIEDCFWNAFCRLYVLSEKGILDFQAKSVSF